MIIHDGKTLRNLQEQVEKNKEDILFSLEQEGTLNKFGIKVIGQADTAAELPTVADYKAAHADWEYGDTYAIGTDSPYVLDVLTRANGTHPNDYWFNIGTFPLAGPKGEKGDDGIGIDTMQVIDFPNGTPQVTYDTTDGTMVHGKLLITYMDGNTQVTKEVSNVTVEIPVVYKNGLKADATMNNDMVEVQVDKEKIMAMPDLDQGNYGLAVAVGKWFSGTSSTKHPDAIQWRDFQKNVKNNAMVQRTENGNVLLPNNFPADVGGGKDQYGNDISKMAVPKSYADSLAGGATWHSTPPTDTTKVLATRILISYNAKPFDDQPEQSMDMTILKPSYAYCYEDTGLAIGFAGAIVSVGCHSNYDNNSIVGIGSVWHNGDDDAISIMYIGNDGKTAFNQFGSVSQYKNNIRYLY